MPTGPMQAFADPLFRSRYTHKLLRDLGDDIRANAGATPTNMTMEMHMAHIMCGALLPMSDCEQH